MKIFGTVCHSEKKSIQPESLVKYSKPKSLWYGVS